MDNDPGWPRDVGRALHAADDAVDRIAAAFTGDDDAAGAAVGRDVGTVFVSCAAAVCSAIADLTETLRKRPA